MAEVAAVAKGVCPPALSLGSYPTRLERLDIGGAELWIKHDDETSALYGGNKIRKLERLFAEAKAEGKRRILTLGAVGSHQVLAAALFGEQLGFEVEAVLVPQPRSEHAVRNVRAALAHGLEATCVPGWSLAPAAVLCRRSRDTYWVPLGGSNPLGTLGFVDAGRELAAQIGRGEMPEPDVVAVALGSGGTAAGLAVGLEQAGLATRVVAVTVTHPAVVLSYVVRRLARRTARLAGVSPERAAERIIVERQWIGRGYGYPTPEGEAATEAARSVGVKLDPTYTAKALACALARARAGKECVLYWHTLSGAPLAAGDAPLPPKVERLLR